MYLLTIIIYFVTFLKIFNASSELDNYSEGLDLSWESRHRHVLRRFYFWINIVSSLFHYERNRSVNINFNAYTVTNLCSLIIKRALRDINFADRSIMWKDLGRRLDLSEIKDLRDNKYDEYRKCYHRLQIYSRLLDVVAVKFERCINDPFNDKILRRAMKERLESLADIYKTFHNVNWRLNQLFEIDGYDQETHDWKNKEKVPFLFYDEYMRKEKKKAEQKEKERLSQYQ